MKVLKCLLFFLLLVIIGVGFLISRWPKPTGSYPVGTKIYHWFDNQREEGFTKDPSDKREVIAQFWYPAKITSQNKKAPYFLPVKIINNFHHNVLLAFFINHLNFFKTSSYQEAAVLKESYPLIVFFHGYGGFRGQNTLLMEHLASHGYVVVSLDSLYETSFVIFSNGRLERSKTTPPEDYSTLEGEKLLQDLIDIRIADLNFLLAQIKSLNAPTSFFHQIINENKTAIIGHSLGGMTTHEACRQNQKFQACVNFDAPIIMEDLVNYYPPLLEIIAAETGDPPQLDAVFYQRLKLLLKNLTNIGIEVVVKESGHYDFTDLAFVKLPMFGVFNAVGKISGQKINRLTNELVLNFFDMTLKNKETDYFDKKAWGNPDLIFLN